MLIECHLCICSRDEVKTKWSVSDFIKAFIKFHGHVYLSKSLEKLNSLREKLEEQFQVQVQGLFQLYLNAKATDSGTEPTTA